MKKWEELFEQKIKETALVDDPAHDFLHVKRVVKLAKSFCELEGAKTEVVLPAAWFHDFVVIPKNSPQRSQASRLCAEKAIEFLRSINYTQEYFEEIKHAIEAHSFSANIEPKTIEAKIVQDADRLDGLGAIGVARCFATAGLLKRAFYSETDPMCVSRDPDDSTFTIDHFYKKLFKTAATLKTASGIQEGLRRTEFMRSYLNEFDHECMRSSVDNKSVNNWRPPTLSTEHLILRELKITDATAIFDYAKNPNVCRYTLWETHKTIADSEAYLYEYVFPYYAKGVPEPFGVALKENPNKIIGTVGCFWVSKAARTMELAYAISEDYWGRGLVAEASRAVMDYCIKEFNLNRIQARCKVENKASARVMQKLDMKFEGTLKSAVFHRNRFWDMHYYAKVLS